LWHSPDNRKTTEHCKNCYYYYYYYYYYYHHHFKAIIHGNLHQPAPPVKKWRILSEQSFTARIPLLMASGIWHIQIREKMLEFSLVVLPALFPYLADGN